MNPVTLNALCSHALWHAEFKQQKIQSGVKILFLLRPFFWFFYFHINFLMMKASSCLARLVTSWQDYILEFQCQQRFFPGKGDFNYLISKAIFLTKLFLTIFHSNKNQLNIFFAKIHERNSSSHKKKNSVQKLTCLTLVSRNFSKIFETPGIRQKYCVLFSLLRASVVTYVASSTHSHIGRAS